MNRRAVHDRHARALALRVRHVVRRSPPHIRPHRTVFRAHLYPAMMVIVRNLESTVLWGSRC